jgi:predicted RNA-binding protein with RPS1 domain
VIDFPGYLARTREADDLPRAEILKVEARCREGLGVAEMLERFGGEITLPAAHVRRVRDAFLRFETLQRAAEFRRGRLPDEVLDEATAPHQLDALDRAAATLGPDPATLRAALALWTRCLALARRDGEVRVEADLHHPGATQFDDDIRRTEKLGSLASHRWLRWRRGERDGVLRLRLVLPSAVMEAQSRAVLGPYLGARDPSEALRSVVLADLEGVLGRMLDEWAEGDAIRTAQNVFAGVLRTPRLQADRVGTVHVGRGFGAAVLGSTGEVVESAATDDLAEVAALLSRHGVEAVVLPTRAADGEKLAQAQRLLSKGRRLQQVSPAGLDEARKGVAGVASRRAASAVVLGRRAIDPMREWTRLDPVRLGLAEYQQDLDDRTLRAAFEETLRIVRADQGRPAPVRPEVAVVANPVVRHVDDLRPGVMVQGVITSVTQFGAFVNLGLANEGLIHVSELADRFVDDPSTVVTVGQRVLAKVLGVDRARGRISLSLRREERPARERGGTSRGAKAQALSDLERLFRKG